MSNNRINDEQKMILESHRNDSKFGLSLKDLEDLINMYRSRKYNEDIAQFAEYGGVAGLCEKLCTSVEYGLSGDLNDVKKREDVFDTNYRAPPQRTPFCTLFFGALEDFMLRLLLVCAAISIIFDMAFSPAD
jgi:Cation transporter/ATPase, N-terminus